MSSVGPIQALTDACPLGASHTPCPGDYQSWHEWASEKSHTHHQVRCTGCGFWMIWVPGRLTDQPEVSP